ncbi:MAG TPA: hypothetical protein VIO57_02430 [Chloroflexota bacterium]
MAEPTHQPLLLPVAYWPARTATYWWDDFRRDEVVRDFNLAAAAGVSQLHIVIPWEVSQPHSERVSLSLMRDLEMVSRVASDSGIRIIVSIAVAAIFEVLTLPHWFYELTADEHASPVRIMRRLFEDPMVVRGTGRLVAELTGEFGSHPSLRGWVIGDGILSASPPRSAERIDQWLDRVLSSAPRHGRPIWHGVSARDIALHGSFRPATLADSDVGLLVHVDWKPSWANDTRLWATFLATYVRALGGLPPLLVGTARYPVPANHAPEETVVGTTRDLASAGAAGLIWPALFDYDPGLRSRPPFNTSPGELTRGLMSVGDELSSSARAWLDLSADPRQVDAPSWAQLDDESRARDPEGFMRLAFNEFVA